MLKKVCPVCGKEFEYPHWRKNVKSCSVACAHVLLRAKPETTCVICGKSIHIKPYHKERYGKMGGFCCSKECLYEYKRIWFSGKNNHQYGLKGDKNSSFKGEEIPHKNHVLNEIMVYCPDHPYADKNNRVAKHRLIVEENHELFPSDKFDIINNRYVLKRGLQIHHIDGNHDNNDISNLQIVTRSEHSAIHSKLKPRPRSNTTGRFIKMNGYDG